MINILIPMAGLGSRFSKAGYKDPKPFIDVNGKPMIQRVIENLYVKDCNFILVANEKHVNEYQDAINVLKNSYSIKIVPINHLTEGTACTVLKARKYIQNDNELIIANSDQIIDIEFDKFINDARSKKLDGSIITFKDKELNPKWSFAKLNANGLVEKVKEKQAISENATVGVYYFSSGDLFVNSSIDMIVDNERVNNEFYTCPVYNHMIKDGYIVGIYDIAYNKMHGIGTPEDLNEYLKKNIFN